MASGFLRSLFAGRHLTPVGRDPHPSPATEPDARRGVGGPVEGGIGNDRSPGWASTSTTVSDLPSGPNVPGAEATVPSAAPGTIPSVIQEGIDTINELTATVLEVRKALAWFDTAFLSRSYDPRDLCHLTLDRIRDAVDYRLEVS